MLKSIVITILLSSGAFALTTYYIGYPGAGKEYFKKATKERKSIRSGSGYYVPYHGGSGSFRSGK
jgi:hypothetical protein